MKSAHHIGVSVACLMLSGCVWDFGGDSDDLSAGERLGKRLFDDTDLSLQRNQACAACHGLRAGGTGPEAIINAHGAVYEGSVAGRFGNRKPPSTTYATFAPLFTYDASTGFVGGNFWDGRATGWKLGSPAADQAQGPFLNPVEQALPDSEALVCRVCSSDYGDLFRKVWGKSACEDSEKGYADIARSIATYEASNEVNAFSSKYDAYLAGKVMLSKTEKTGLDLFTGRAKCSGCHVLEGAPPVLTDFTFDNLGVPPNPENPFYGMDKVTIDGQPINPAGADWVDIGLAGFIEQLVQDAGWRQLPYVPAEMLGLDLASMIEENRGKQRVPTLRNVDRRPTADFVKAYGHNGYFKSLNGIVHFYNTRDVLPRCDGRLTEQEALAQKCWPAPEVSENINQSELGNLGLSADEEEAIVAFLGTLSDGCNK